MYIERNDWQLAVALKASGLALVLLSACGGGGNDGPAPRSVTDQLGRHCKVDIDTIVAPTCDKDPMPSVACSADSKACFQLGSLEIAAQYKPGAMCAACCGATSSTGHSEDCSAIVCKSDDDCPYDYPMCSNGQCFMEH